MAESKDPADLFGTLVRNAVERQSVAIESRFRFIIIAVHDDEEQVKVLKKIATNNANSTRTTRVFDNVDECFAFVTDEVSSNPNVPIVIFVGGRLVTDLVSSIHYCEQVQLILIANKPPFNEEERESMKMYAKVNKGD